MGVVEMAYVRMSKPIVLSIYERVRDALAEAWVGKTVAKKEENIQTDLGIPAVHWELCNEYRNARSAGQRGYEFSLIQIDLKEGDAASLFAPLSHAGLELMAVTSHPKYAAFFVPARHKEDYVKKLHERFEAIGAKAYVAATDMRDEGEPGYSAMPTKWDDYKLVDTRKQIEAVAVEPAKEFKMHVERKPLELDDLLVSYAA